MKKAAICVSALFWAAIVFFTAFGDRLYGATKPEVTVDFTAEMDGWQYLPESAVFEEPDGSYVYTLSSETGFSREILTVTRHRLSEVYPDDVYFDGYVKFKSEEPIRGLTVVSSTKPLHDGERVVQGASWE